MFFSRPKKLDSGRLLPQPTVQQLYPGDKALQKLATLARSGDADAQYRVGLHHLEGDTRSVVMAVIYLRDAAKSGHLDARMQIARALMQGFDDPSGIGKTFCLFCSLLALNIASFNADEPWVMEEINAGGLTFAYLYCMKLIFSKREHEAFALLAEQARNHGSMLAMGALGYCYAEGKSVPQNFVEAYVWFNMAAAVGLRAAAGDRDRLAEKLTPAQLVDAQHKASNTFTSFFGPEAVSI